MSRTNCTAYFLGELPVALIKMCQGSSYGGGGVSCSLNGNTGFTIPSNLTALTDLTRLSMSSWSLTGKSFVPEM